jgi:hypothetical protein
MTADKPQQPPPSGGNVKVFCRFRPLNEREKGLGETSNTVCQFMDKQTIEVEGQVGKQKYTFDRIFNSDASA